MPEREIDATQRSPIVGFAILAAVLSAAIASGIGFALGDEITTPEMYARHGSSGDALFEFAAAGAIAVGAAFLVWLVFHLWMFRKRAKLWKSLVALLAIVLTTALIAMPVRVGTLVAHFAQDEDAVAAMFEEERAQRREIRARLAPNMDGMRMDQGQPALARVQDMVDHRARLQEALEKMRAYRTAINAHLEQSRAAIEAMDIYSSVKEDAVAYYDDRLEPQSNVQRHLVATEEMLQGGVDIATYLLDHRSAWVIENGRVAFTDRAAWEEVQRRAAALDVLGGELDRLQGAMGLEMGDEEPAQPPPTANP